MRVCVCSGELCQFFYYKTTTFVFGMEVVVILLVNVLLNFTC